MIFQLYILSIFFSESSNKTKKPMDLKNNKKQTDNSEKEIDFVSDSSCEFAYLNL